MTGLDRAAAVDRVERLVETVESDPMPVPVREIWVYGDLALGLDPVERLDVYLTKDMLFGRDSDRESEFEKSHGIEGVGKTVDADWAEQFPEHLRANTSGHAAPEKCLAAHLVGDDEPIHLEVCNASFEDNVTQRLEGAVARDDYTQILDPRGVCLWVDGEPSTARRSSAGDASSAGGERSDEAFRRLHESELAFPPLSGALEMLGLDSEDAVEAAETVESYWEKQDGVTVRGDVV